MLLSVSVFTCVSQCVRVCVVRCWCCGAVLCCAKVVVYVLCYVSGASFTAVLVCVLHAQCVRLCVCIHGRVGAFGKIPSSLVFPLSKGMCVYVCVCVRVLWVFVAVSMCVCASIK